MTNILAQGSSSVPQGAKIWDRSKNRIFSCPFQISFILGVLWRSRRHSGWTTSLWSILEVLWWIPCWPATTPCRNSSSEELDSDCNAWNKWWWAQLSKEELKCAGLIIRQVNFVHRIHFLHESMVEIIYYLYLMTVWHCFILWLKQGSDLIELQWNWWIWKILFYFCWFTRFFGENF